MKKIFWLAALALLWAGCQQTPTAVPPPPAEPQPSSERLLLATLWFQRSAEMQASYFQAYNWATRVVAEKLAAPGRPQKPAVVFDIDETLLDNSPYEAKLIETAASYSPEGWKQWTDLAKAQPLPGSVEFLNFLDSAQVKIFYISNRSTDELESTLKNMRELGFPQVGQDNLFLKEQTSDKTARREKVAQAGFQTILYVGDNLTDFSEDYADRGADMGRGLVEQNRDKMGFEFIMLPNPMYGEWEKAALLNSWNWAPAQRDSLFRAALRSF